MGCRDQQSRATLSILIVAGSLILLAQAKETTTSFDFPNFNSSSVNDIALKENANAENNRIYLTNSGTPGNSNGNLGWALYKSPIRLWNKQLPRIHGFKSLYQWRKKLPPLLGNFQSHFQFTLDSAATTQKTALAFFMAPVSSESPLANGSSEMWLGLFSNSTNSTAPSQAVAIEFDSNLVGLHVDNISFVASNLLPANQRLNNGNITWDAWIEYNATGMALSVFLANVSSKPAEPILRKDDINFSQILPRDVIVGFSASATRGNVSIISWNFSSQTPRSRKTPVKVIIFTMFLTTSAIISACACTCTVLLNCICGKS